MEKIPSGASFANNTTSETNDQQLNVQQEHSEVNQARVMEPLEQSLKLNLNVSAQQKSSPVPKHTKSDIDARKKSKRSKKSSELSRAEIRATINHQRSTDQELFEQQQRAALFRQSFPKLRGVPDALDLKTMRALVAQQLRRKEGG